MSIIKSEPAAPRPPANDSMRRFQIGIAGLLTVLLLVGLAGLIGDRAQKEANASVAAGTPVPPTDADKGGEPLVELGVQPSADADATVKAGPPIIPLQPGATVPDLQPDPVLERARQKKK